MDLKEFAAEKAIDLVFHEIDKDPEAAIQKVVDLVFKLDKKDGLHNQKPTIEAVAKDPDNVWHKYVLDMRIPEPSQPEKNTAATFPGPS